ncbi:MAG: hypothetical protein ACP5D0_08785 [Hydrogenovibrio sp.]
MSRAIESQARVTVDLDWDKLLELMQSGVLCGADIHASDPETKAMIRQACLKSCVQKVCAQCPMNSMCAQPGCDVPIWIPTRLPS